MRLLLFGPPGIGKSTLTGLLKSAGIAALDLEDVDSRVRYSLTNQVTTDPMVMAAADHDPKRAYPGWKKVLLVTDQDTYDQRRAQRDAQTPGKANQQHHEVSAWQDGVKWDYIIDTTGKTAQDTRDDILKLLGKSTS